MSRQGKTIQLRRKISDLGRRTYRELVRGRTRVRIVDSNQPINTATWPGGFILSPYRSGTTLLRYCLDSHPDLAVPPETDFLAPLSGLLTDGPSMQGVRDIGYSEEDWHRAVSTFGRKPFDIYASSRNARVWVDKSPRYAENPHDIALLFPQARFIILHRHPLDQIASFTRQGTFCHPALGTQCEGEVLIRRAADYWSHVTQGVLEFTRRPDIRSLSVTYEDLCSQPVRELSAIADHLRVEYSPEMVRYDAHEHDVGREAGRVSGTRGFDATTGKWRAWPTPWQDAAWESVERVARSVGYDRD